MTSLRQQMIEAMQQHGFSPRTHECYLRAVTDLARFSHRSPDQLTTDDLQAYFAHLVRERQLANASCRLYLNGIRFFYLKVLGWKAFDVPIVLPKRPQQIPELLTRKEVAAIIHACHNEKHRMMLLTCYGCGLRVNELVSLKVRHIDGERRLLRVEQGKGRKDRMVTLSDQLLERLRRYWRIYRPSDWLFPSSEHFPGRHLDARSIQRVYRRCKAQAGIRKRGGIHALRHAYATHLLEAGLAVNQLQHLMGHRDIHSTLGYLHWLPRYNSRERVQCDLIAHLGGRA
ncbi:integrase [Sedimenticola thiotaurini]|uniref:Integrase n=2 Tax=Sedimenticola thiotaurini TaxID=1543721 RepID=A0A0F7K228_9GAMM|nr:site-specific integrase [Sedimenticola thiotaurini]AKH20887.1 integrase [Sedimenticola thiotaurini]AKH21599.1 integrase [Sedimenticola thiotaurini]